MRKYFIGLLSLLLVVSMLPLSSSAAKTQEPDVDLWNAVKPLDTTVTFLNTGAHPDDERSDFLAYLSRGLGVKTASMIANRGEGGQNEIGNELGNGLGIIRSREMIEAAKITGVTAYHLSETTNDAIYDFGFSKSPDETLEKWDEDIAYERLIRFIRTYQPDIVMPSFRNSPTQHGHHRAMEILSEKAFEDAADPSVYPEQLKEGLSVWQIKKLFLPAESKETATTSIEIGMYDPIYQMSYPQLGEASRYMHKSQGMGNDIPVAPRETHLELLYSAVDTNGSNELFAGVPYDFAAWAKTLPKNANSLSVQYTKLQDQLESIIESYPDRDAVFTQTQKALKDVLRLQKKTENAKLDDELKTDLLHKLNLKEEQLQTASFVSSSLDVNAEAASTVLTKGQDTTVTVTLENNGSQKLEHLNVELLAPEGWTITSKAKDADLAPGKTATLTFDVSVPEDAEFYHAYKEPVLQAKVTYKNKGASVEQVKQLEGTIAVLPDAAVTLNPEDIIVNTANVQDEIPVTAKVKNYFNGASQAVVSLKAPEGWEVEPKTATVDFSAQFEEKEVAFTLSPPEGIQSGDFNIDAEVAVNGKTFNSTIQEISYDHIGTFYYQYPAQVNGVAFELLTNDNLKVGYIDSGFDLVADYLSNAGMNITKLTEADLASADLSQYDTIVVGIRAYLSRADLIANNARLLKYVEDGGHLVVQYHKPNDGWNKDTTAPYPLTIGNVSIKWRVTDENAKVNILQPESPLFNYPNKITDSDWDNWIQERGLYYPMAWGPEYQTFVSMADPGEDAFDGGILMANYGKGTYLYTNLVFYRQIQGQVPGGYRIFTNLISYGSQE
ncbi:MULTISPECIES: NEW3 domain-containing protein [unclassified Mesobacillus]|uniref:NEW3 domain-containing protein n=1 Tax=unclassified Mesobacillus TaxID=2675270 RepID=UPI00203F013C|nr:MULTISPECIES: NEW3 domain-containing protein [unclassified Mesobacillus]MCM3124224.1 NEW3 domain-containing protein [Mesobacillus sp. MER 33]MCM3234073.1 NEW3 domain-containing protein [Mesobacillus sp. MER 48]